jgi:ATP-dependent DNA helicase RecG
LEKRLIKLKLIAEAFYLTGDIEKCGTGLLRIRNEIKEYRTMKFKLQEIANGFKATLLYTNQKTDKVTEKQLAMLKLITQKKHITTSELAVKLDISQRKIKENIAKLKVAGLLELVGPAKGGYWKIVN